MRFFFGIIFLFASALAVAGAVVGFLFFLSYRTGLSRNANLLLSVFILVGGIWFVEWAWRKIIGASDE
jgi:hypothetical protein